MPEVTVRKRKRRAAPSAQNWVALNRPKIVVMAAFLVAAIIGVMAVRYAQVWAGQGASEAAAQ